MKSGKTAELVSMETSKDWKTGLAEEISLMR